MRYRLSDKTIWAAEKTTLNTSCHLKNPVGQLFTAAYIDGGPYQYYLPNFNGITSSVITHQ